MPEDGGGGDSVLGGERVVEGERERDERGLAHRGTFELGGKGGRVEQYIPQRSALPPIHPLEQLRRVVHMLAEGCGRAVQRLPHPDVLGPLPREHKRQPRRRGMDSAGRRPRAQIIQPLKNLHRCAAHHRGAVTVGRARVRAAQDGRAGEREQLVATRGPCGGTSVHQASKGGSLHENSLA